MTPPPIPSDDDLARAASSLTMEDRRDIEASMLAAWEDVFGAELPEDVLQQTERWVATGQPVVEEQAR